MSPFLGLYNIQHEEILQRGQMNKLLGKLFDINFRKRRTVSGVREIAYIFMFDIKAAFLILLPASVGLFEAGISPPWSEFNPG
jgi:hypothetical protein